MNETVNFNAEAIRLIAALGIENDPHTERLVADAMRLVWNARGAADIATVERELSTMMGATAAGPYVKNLERAQRALDRR